MNEVLDNFQLAHSSAFKSTGIVKHITPVVGELQLVGDVMLTTLRKKNNQQGSTKTERNMPRSWDQDESILY
jgi:hypothetical protein